MLGTAGLAALVAGATWLAMSPGVSGPQLVAVVAVNGSCSLRLVERNRLDLAEAGLETEAQRISGMAGRVTGDAAQARFALAREAVPGFGDWAYGWVQSYVTSYRVLGRMVTGLAQAATTNEDASLFDRVAAEMAEPIRTEFRARVLAPATERGGIGADLANAGLMVNAAWAEALRGLDAGLAGPAPEGTTAAATAPRFDLRAAAAAPGPGVALGVLIPADPLDLVESEGVDSGGIFLRSMRPMAARLGAVAVRLTEVGSIIAAVGAFGYAIAGAPGLALGTIGGVGVSWSIDWAISRVDAALNREAFEAQALTAIDRAELHLAERASAVVGEALAARRAALRAGGFGCP